MLTRGYQSAKWLLAFARGSRAGQSGGVAVEFAFVLPVLIVVLLGIVQFGMAFFLQNNMVNAAREAARKLAVGTVNIAGSSSCPGADGSAQKLACDYLSGWGGMTFTVTACDPDNPDATLCPGADDVTVEITVPRSQVALGDILGLFESGTIEARVTIHHE